MKNKDIDTGNALKAPHAEAVTFRDDALAEMTALRLAIRGVLSDLDGVGKPADLQRALKLDQTLSWQLFKIVSGTDVLSGGSAVPSRTSIERFLKAAKARGVAAAKLQQVLTAYTGFEQLIDIHAGDRVTFNSMISAAAGLDEDWQATDLQHRRNMYRGLSHAMGMRTKTRLQLTIISDAPTEDVSDFIMITGMVDFRILRDFPRVRVYAMKTDADDSVSFTRRPLTEGKNADGYFLSGFSSDLSATLKTAEKHTENGSVFEAFMEWPEVGKVGSKNMMFGEMWHRYPFERVRAWNSIITSPMEVVINDMLVMPGALRGLTPRAEVYWGAAGAGSDVQGAAVEGNYAVERLGTGPDALATPDVPNYPAMARASAANAGWDIEKAEAWRVRVEYPMFRTNVQMTWEKPLDGG